VSTFSIKGPHRIAQTVDIKRTRFGQSPSTICDFVRVIHVVPVPYLKPTAVIEYASTSAGTSTVGRVAVIDRYEIEEDDLINGFPSVVVLNIVSSKGC
jgi:hypothetical protein